MLENPLDTEDVKFDVDITEFPDDDLEWEEVEVGTLEKHRKDWNIPLLNIDPVKAFSDLSLGTYR